jgi:pimeloyl-ACP methyl ester carboxylesterase
MGIPYEEVTVRSGSTELQAWLLDASGSNEARTDGDERRPVVIVAHGWGANHGVVARLAEPLARKGWTVFLFDVRGHGRNLPLPEVTFRDFRDDVLAVTRHVRERFPRRPLVLVGHSMGGAAGVVAGADGAPIDGLVTIAAPSDVLGVTAEYLSDHGMPGELLVTVLRPFFWRRVGGTFRPFTPSRRIDELTVPIMMIQPERDARVVRTHADRLAAATGLDYHVIEGREHTDVLSDPRTLELVEGFVESVGRDGTVEPDAIAS